MVKNKLDKKVVEEKSYRTSDNKLFIGIGALVKAKKHQKMLNLEKSIESFTLEAGLLFNLSKEILEKNQDSKKYNTIIDDINEHIGNFNHFDTFFEGMAKFYIKHPSILDMFKLIDREFKKGK